MLLHEVSAGTFARLYLAQARAPGGLERLVAVKIVREQWGESDEVITRTRDEARLLARLRHRNILRVEELMEIDGHLAILMEYVDGLDLKQLVEGLAAKREKIPARAALRIVAEAASAIDAAYNKIPLGMDRPLQVVHRDVKPSNIMVSVEGEVKVLDFGTARSTSAFRTAQTGAIRMGSLKYMSPERRDGDRGGHPGDVYALGLTLLELLLGGWLELLPLDPEEHDAEVVQAVNSLAELGMPNQQWDLSLRQFIVRMLASNPDYRPGAEEVARTLRAFVEQGTGPMLDTFAADKIAPLTAQVRGTFSGGALAGRKVTVSVDGSGPQGEGSLLGASGPQGTGGKASAPQGTAGKASGPQGTAGKASGPQGTNPPPATPGKGSGPQGAVGKASGPTGASGPSSASQGPAIKGGSPVNSPESSQRPPPRSAAPGQVPFGPPVVAVRPPERSRVEPLRPEKRRSERPSVEPEADTGSRIPLWLLLGAAVFLVGGLVLLIGVIAGGVLMNSSPPPMPVAVTVPETPVPVDAAAGGTTTVVGTADGTPGVAVGTAVANAIPAASTSAVPFHATAEGGQVQWLRLDAADGSALGKSTDGLNLNVEPGSYKLVVKFVGRPMLSGDLSVPKDGVTLACSLQKDGTVACTGGKGKLVLRG